jgi:hypothetical protein
MLRSEKTVPKMSLASSVVDGLRVVAVAAGPLPVVLGSEEEVGSQVLE